MLLWNAERLHANREFRQDMLLTVECSLEKMQRLSVPERSDLVLRVVREAAGRKAAGTDLARSKVNRQGTRYFEWVSRPALYDLTPRLPSSEAGYSRYPQTQDAPC